jgi:predicted DNA-binding transcriptional regulator AlpA
MSEKRCYTVQKLQEILEVSRPTIYNLLKKKEFR